MKEIQVFASKENVMTVKQVAEALGVSYDTVNNAVKRLFPELVKNGVKTYLSERHIACISKELKSNVKVTEQMTFEAASKVKNTTTELEVLGNAIAAFDNLRNLYAQKEAEYKAIIEQKDQQLEVQAPKVEVYDSISDSSTLQDLQTVAQTIKLKNIFEVLKADKILEEKMTADGTKYYKPYARYAEYLVLKDGKAWTDNKGKKHIRPRVFVTGKGLLWLSKKYKVAC
jgi:phage antirepressor YoqD-like protein